MKILKDFVAFSEYMNFTEILNWTKKLIPLYGELIFPYKYSNYLSIVHTVYRQVSILFIFKHDFRWRIDFGPNRPWKGFAWASTHLHVPRCNLSFLPPSIREVGKEKMSILELNSIGLECLTQGWHQFRGCQLWFCFDQFDYYFRTIWLLFVSNSI